MKIASDLLELSVDEIEEMPKDDFKPAPPQTKKPRIKFLIFEKPGVKVYRIGHKRPYNRHSKYRVPKGVLVEAIVREDKLVFRNTPYILKDGKFIATGQAKICFSVKNGKLNVYRISGQKKLGNLQIRNHSMAFNQSSFEAYYRGLKKTHLARIKLLTKRFFKKHNFYFDDNLSVPTNAKIACYPCMAEFFKINEHGCLWHYSTFFRKGFKYAVRRVFGNAGSKLNGIIWDRIRKDKNLSVFVLGDTLRGLVPNEYIQEIASRDSYWQLPYNKREIVLMRNLLKNYPKERIKILFSGPFTKMYYDDAARLHNVYPGISLPEKPKSFHDIHDYLVRESFKIEHKEQVLDLKEEWVALESKSYGPNNEFRIIFPRSNYDLLEWGKKLHHCIGGYFDRMKSGECILLAVLKNGEMLYNLDIRRKEINQFRGVCNGLPEPSDQSLTETFLMENNIVSNYKRIHIDNCIAAVIRNPAIGEIEEEF